MPFTIFVSHRTEDRALVSSLRGHLHLLSEGKVECSVSDKIPGAADWHDWIAESTRQADLLLFLYTTADHDWNWSALEIGRFQGAKEAQKRPAHVAWFLGDGLKGPPFISKYQYYTTDSVGVDRFLQELLVLGTFTGKKPISSEVRTDKFDDYGKAVKQIADTFSRIAQPEEYFNRRIKITFPTLKELIDKQADAVQLDAQKRVGILCKRGQVQIQPGTSFLLGVADEPITTFEAVAEAQARLACSEWIDDILRYLSRSFADVDQDMRQQREQILTPIARDGKLYQPVVARLEYSGGWPTAMVVIFVKMPPFSEDPYLMISQGIPKTIVYISVLARLSRRFRWCFLDPLAHAAEVVAPESPTDDVFWKNFDVVFGRSRLALDYIEQEGNDPVIVAPGNVRALLGIKERDLLNTLWTTYPTRKAKLLSAVESRSAGKILSILREWQKENKAFMLLLTEKFIEEIMKLEPVDLPYRRVKKVTRRSAQRQPTRQTAQRAVSEQGEGERSER